MRWTVVAAFLVFSVVSIGMVGSASAISPDYNINEDEIFEGAKDVMQTSLAEGDDISEARKDAKQYVDKELSATEISIYNQHTDAVSELVSSIKSYDNPNDNFSISAVYYPDYFTPSVGTGVAVENETHYTLNGSTVEFGTLFDQSDDFEDCGLLGPGWSTYPHACEVTELDGDGTTMNTTVWGNAVNNIPEAQSRLYSRIENYTAPQEFDSHYTAAVDNGTAVIGDASDLNSTRDIYMFGEYKHEYSVEVGDTTIAGGTGGNSARVDWSQYQGDIILNTTESGGKAAAVIEIDILMYGDSTYGERVSFETSYLAGYDSLDVEIAYSAYDTSHNPSIGIGTTDSHKEADIFRAEVEPDEEGTIRTTIDTSNYSEIYTTLNSAIVAISAIDSANISDGITGNVFECPTSDPDCTNNPYGPGVGPDAHVEVWNEGETFLIEETNTSADGTYTLESDIPNGIYNVDVYVGGQLRYDQDMGISSEQGVGRIATVPMRTPSLSNYAPADGVTLATANATLSANLSDADFPSDEVTVEWFNAANDNKIGEDTLTADGTASTSWAINQSGNYGYYVTATDKYNYTNIYVSETRTFEVTQEAVASWDIDAASASPSGGEYVTTSHTHSIDLANLNESNVRVRFYDGDGTQIGADTVSGNGTKTASISHSVGGPGNYAWYVVAEDQDSGVTRASTTFQYAVAGGLRVRDAGTGNLIDDRTVTAEFTVAGDTYDVQVSDGRIDYATDLPMVPDENFVADVDAAGYYGTSLNIYDAANVQQVYLQKEGTDAPVSTPDGDFDVSISGSNEPVQASETAQVEVTATNNIGSSQSGVLTMYVDGDKVDYKSIQQQGNQQKVHTLSWVPTTSGTKSVVVESGTDSASMNFDVNAAPSPAGNFSVDIIGSNSPVDEDQTLNVDVNVTDRTGAGTSGTLVGTIDGGNETVATTSVNLNASESKNVTLSWTTDLDSAGTYDFVAESGCADAVCSDNTTVEINEVEDAEGVPEDDILNVLFTLQDRTGDFTPVSNTTLIIQRRLNGTWNEVESGKFGAANQYQASLIRNEPYNLVVRKDNRIRDIGGFRTNVSGEFDLIINQRAYPTDRDRPWKWNATYVEDTDQIKFSYKDEANATQVLELDIYEYGNASNYLFRKTVNQTLGTYEYSQVLTANQSKSRWVVSFCATRNGNEICREEVVGSGVDDIFSDAPDWLLEIFGALSIIFVAGIFSTVNAKVGAIVTLSFAGLLYAVGVMASALTGIAIAVALAIAVIYKAGDSQI